MADEFQLASGIAEVTLRDADAAGAQQIAALTAEVTHQTKDIFPLQMASVYAEVTHQTKDIFETQVAYVFMEVIRSLPDMLLPEFIERPSSLELWPVESITAFVAPNPTPVAKTTTIEANPYRPDVPIHLASDDPDLYEYLREQAELLRQQHNLIQAGDSTFPWELATTPALTPEFTLGSYSRFIHDTSGLLEGRFVQFRSGIVAPRFVGFDKGSVEWVATNDPRRTSKWRPLGLTLPAGDLGGKYGWVLTRGRPPVSIGIDSEAPLRVDQALTWDPANPDVLSVGPGPVVARVLDPTPGMPGGSTGQMQRTILPAGCWVLEVSDGVSPEFIDSRTAENLADIEEQIATLEAAIEALESQDYQTAIIALQKQQALLDRKLALESQQRTTTDSNLNRKIETLNAAVRLLQSSQAGSGFDPTDIYAQIDSLRGLVARETAAADARLDALELWKTDVDNLLASLVASVESNQRPALWHVTAVGTGDPQAILLLSNGLAAEQVSVFVNGLKWGTTEYTILEQELTITTNAAGDLVEIMGF